MEPTNIIPMDKLPSKALKRIFSYSKRDEILNLALTCKTFSNLINSDPSCSRSLWLRLNKKNLTNKWTGCRSYSIVYLDGAHAVKYWPIIEKLDPKPVRHFACNSSKIKISMLKKILLKFPNLTSVSVGDNDQKDATRRDFEEPLPRLNLNWLVYQGSSRNFGIFKACQTKHLDVDKLFDENNDDDNFRDFLLSQKNLIDLKLSNFTRNSTLFSESYSKIDFRLNRLELKYFLAWDQENFHSFVEPHKDTLEHLELIWGGEMLPHFEEFSKLKEVKLEKCDLPDVDAELKSVIHVTLNKVAKGFHNFFPNLTSLWFENVVEHLGDFKANESLRVVIFEKCKIPQLELPQITKIVLLEVKLKDERPFNYATVKNIDEITIRKSSTKWLPNYLEQLKTKLYTLKLEGVKIDWKLKWALEGFSDKIENLVTIDCEEVEEDYEESDYSSAIENASNQENDDDEWSTVSEESNEDGSSDDNESTSQPLEYNPQAISELVEDLSKVETINNDIFSVIKSLTDAYEKGNAGSDDESVTSMGRKKFTDFLDFGGSIDVGKVKGTKEDIKKDLAPLADFKFTFTHPSAAKFSPSPKKPIEAIEGTNSGVKLNHKRDGSIGRDDDEQNPKKRQKEPKIDVKCDLKPLLSASKFSSPQKVKQLNFNLQKFKANSDKKSPPKHLDELPEEILIEIFKLLPFKDRLNISQISDRFLQATSTSKFMKNFKLNLKDEQIIDGLREYQTVVVVGRSVDFYVSLFDKLGTSVTDLTLDGSSGFFKVSSALEIIKKCKKLKNLKLKCLNPRTDKVEELEAILLETFAFAGSLELFGCFKKFQTKSLEFTLHASMGNSKRTDFVDFLLNQSDLKCLELSGSEVTPRFSYDKRLLDVKFKLEKLKLHGPEFPPNFVKFVQLFENSLKEISLDKVTKEFLRVVEKFANLKKVRLDQVTQHDEIPRLLGVLMPQVEELEGDFCYGSYLDSFPNIKKLKLSRDCRLLHSMKHCQQLEEVDFYGIEDFGPFKLPGSVKKFKLSNCSPWSTWRNVPVPFNMDNNVVELEICNSDDIKWIANFLHHVRDRKVKISIESCEIPLRLQKALEVYREKIEKLKLSNCTNEENPRNIEIHLSDDEGRESEFESDDEEEEDERVNILDFLNDPRVGFQVFNLGGGDDDESEEEDEDEEHRRHRIMMQYNPFNLD